jgi:hypothetical protein
MSFGQKPFRIPPVGPASAYQTFQIKTPRGPEFERPATCEEVDCDAWRYGWSTRVPVFSTDLLAAVRASGRRFSEYPPGASDVLLGDDVVTVTSAEHLFVFGPGNACFRASQHRLPVRPDLPQIFLARDGDWRGNPRGTQPRVHTRPEDWVEHAQEVTANVVDRIERG